MKKRLDDRERRTHARHAAEHLAIQAEEPRLAQQRVVGQPKLGVGGPRAREVAAPDQRPEDEQPADHGGDERGPRRPGHAQRGHRPPSVDQDRIEDHVHDQRDHGHEERDPGVAVTAKHRVARLLQQSSPRTS